MELRRIKWRERNRNEEFAWEGNIHHDIITQICSNKLFKNACPRKERHETTAYSILAECKQRIQEINDGRSNGKFKYIGNFGCEDAQLLTRLNV